MIINKIKKPILFGHKHRHQGIHTVKATQILKNTPSFQIARPNSQINSLKPSLVQLHDQSRLNNVAKLSFLSRYPLQLSLSNTLMSNSKFRLPHNTTIKSLVTNLKLNQKISLTKAVPSSKNLPFQFSKPLLLSNLRKDQINHFQLFAFRNFSVDSESNILIKLKISVEKMAVQPPAVSFAQSQPSNIKVIRVSGGNFYSTVSADVTAQQVTLLSSNNHDPTNAKVPAHLETNFAPNVLASTVASNQNAKRPNYF